MRRLAVTAVLILLALAAPTAATAATKNTCTGKTGKAVLRQSGKVLQVLSSGQYRAYRFAGGSWTFCDSRAGARSAFKSFNFNLSGQRYTGAKLLSRPGRCVALQLRPQKNGIPSVPTVDMRPGKGISASVKQIDFSAPGARIVSVRLSSTCLLATGYVSAAGARVIQLDPILPPNVLQDRITLSSSATDADLRALSLSGDTVAWRDAGAKQSKRYSGPPPR